MKRLYTLFFALACLLTTGQAFASNADFFALDEVALEQEMADLTALESYVVETENVSLTGFQGDLTAMNFDFSLASLQAGFTIDDMDWASFAWGFCCWPIGLFVVIFNDDKTNDQKLSYWIGLGVSAVLSIISSVVTAAVR